MRPLALAALGVIAYLAFLAASVPAAFVAVRVERESRGVVRIDEARGTLWHGQARANGLPLQWRFRAASLAAGRLGFDVHVDEPQLKATGEVGRGVRAWQVNDLRAQGSAGSVAALLPLLAPWRPEGTIAIDAPHLAWTPESVDGSAKLEWRGAALALSDVKPLGAYRAELTGAGSEARVALTSLEGPLRLTGNGTLTPAGRLGFKGEARAEGPNAAALQPLLDLLGPRQPDGSRAIGLRSGPD